jgi:signal transduction histidine kinase
MLQEGIGGERRIALPAERPEVRTSEKRARQLEYDNAKLADTIRRLLARDAERGAEVRRLQDADAARSRFLRNLGHELRSPLHSIFALTTLLLRRADGELSREQEESVELIRKAADALLDLADDLADPAKVEGGEVDVRATEFDAAGLLSMLQGMLPAPLVRPGVRLVFDAPTDIPSLYSDQGKVSQILRNLINNSLKFTARGEVRVSVVHDPTSGTVIFSVRDTGAGMARAEQESIFNEWSPANSRAQSPGKGTGLGLPLCRKLAALLGGRITLESELGSGSTFSLVLPRRYRPPHEETLNCTANLGAHGAAGCASNLGRVHEGS